jgi:single-strand DNA-binding protein
LVKGKKIYAEGRLQTREWEAQDGSKKQRTEIVLENMIMLDRAGAPSGSPAHSYPPPSSEPTIDKGIGEEEIRVEDIPF